MSRRALLARFAAALVGIVAVAVAAATVASPPDPVDSEGGGSGAGGDGGGSDILTPTDVQPSPSGEFPPFLEYLLVLFFVLLIVVTIWYVLTHRRDAARLLALGLALGTVVGLAAYLMMIADFGGQLAEPGFYEPSEGGNFGGESGSEGESDSIPFDVPITVLAIVVVLGILASAFVVSGSRDEPEGGLDPGEGPAAEATAVGAAAGRAADRIDATGEGETVDNEVYRAWREMTRLLDVDSPETSTPGEFATAAIDAGLARDHVDELTRLFEDVRYGDVETTPEMESRAVSVLRRIEETYAAETDEATPGPGGDDA